MVFFLKLFFVLIRFHSFSSHPGVGVFKEKEDINNGGTKTKLSKWQWCWQNMEFDDFQLFKILPRNRGDRRRVVYIWISIRWVLVSSQSRGGELPAHRLSKGDEVHPVHLVQLIQPVQLVNLVQLVHPGTTRLQTLSPVNWLLASVTLVRSSPTESGTTWCIPGQEGDTTAAHKAKTKSSSSEVGTPEAQSGLHWTVHLPNQGRSMWGTITATAPFNYPPTWSWWRGDTRHLTLWQNTSWLGTERRLL